MAPRWVLLFLTQPQKKIPMKISLYIYSMVVLFLSLFCRRTFQSETIMCLLCANIYRIFRKLHIGQTSHTYFYDFRLKLWTALGKEMSHSEEFFLLVKRRRLIANVFSLNESWHFFSFYKSNIRKTIKTRDLLKYFWVLLVNSNVQ